MSHVEPQTAATDRPEKPTRRTQRVLSERTADRKARLVAQLVNPAVVAEDVTLLTDQANSIDQAFKPRNGWQDWLTSTIATIMVRLNRCERIERKLRDYASYRAIDFWEDDQIVEVETLATKLERDPAQVVANLRTTPAGLDWLLKRWRFLGQNEPNHWTDEQRTLAGRLSAEDPTQPGFVANEIAELEAIRDKVEAADAILRGLVEADLSDAKVPGLAALRRYSRSLHRQLKWSIDQFHVEHPDRWDDPTRRPAFEMENIPKHDSTWSFTESARKNDETNPITLVDLQPEKGETNPIIPAELERKNDETNPMAPAELERQNDETNPMAPAELERQNDETNPIERDDKTDSQTDREPQVVATNRVLLEKRTSNPQADCYRKRRVNLAREQARRQKAARRRQAMVTGSGV